MKKLDCGMTNLQAYRIGKICEEVAAQTKGVGDFIDRGLILRRRLEEGGFFIFIEGETHGGN